MSASPAGPFETQLTSPNRVLVGGACEALPLAPFGLSCGAILLRDLSPSAARALTSHALWARVPSRVASQGHFEYKSQPLILLSQHREAALMKLF